MSRTHLIVMHDAAMLSYQGGPCSLKLAKTARSDSNRTTSTASLLILNQLKASVLGSVKLVKKLAQQAKLFKSQSIISKRKLYSHSIING